MITRTEQTAWTQQQWDDFIAAYGDLSIQIKVQRYGPSWDLHPGEAQSSRDGKLFDACTASGYLVRCWADSETGAVSVERLASEASSDQSWASVTISLSIDTTIPPSLASSGTAVRIFYYDGSNIEYVECADITAASPSFGVAQTVVAAANLKMMDAVSTTKVYYGLLTSQNNRRMYSAAYTTSWASTASNIYWPFAVYSFKAIALDDYDLILMASMLPPLIDSKIVGKELQNTPQMVQGLVTFRVANGRWSDHETWDVIDRVEDSPARRHVRLSSSDGMILASYGRRDGTGDFTYDKAAVSRTLDGRAWEFPEFITGGLSDFDTPDVLLARDDYLYAVGVNATLRSNPCAWANQTPEEQDVTSFLRSFSLPGGEITKASLGLENPNSVLQSTLADEVTRTRVVCNLGWEVDGTPRRITVFTGDVVGWNHEYRVDHTGLSISANDTVDRINRIKSDSAVAWPSMQAGRDQFTDTTGTGYGGTRFLATLEGALVAEDGTLTVKSYNKETLAVSTFVSDALNGSAQAGIKLNYDDKGEYGGLTFRVFDKSNFCAAIWKPDDAKIYLTQRQGADDDASDVVIASADPSWSISNTNYLKVVTHYGMVYTYISSDGITWSVLMSTEMPGQSDGLADYPVVSGRFGIVGYGYSDVDIPPGWTPEPWPEPIPPLWEGPVKACVAWTANELGYTSDLLLRQIVSLTTAGTTGTTLYDLDGNFNGVDVQVGDLVENLEAGTYFHERTTVAAVVSNTQLTLAADIGLVAGDAYHVSGTEWHDISGSIDLVAEGIIDFVYIRTGVDTVGAWLLTNAAVYYTANILTISPVWSSSLALADIQGIGGGTGVFKAIAVDKTNPARAIVNVSTTGGSLPAHTPLVTGAFETTDTGASWLPYSFSWNAPANPDPYTEYCGERLPFRSEGWQNIVIDGGNVYAARSIDSHSIPSWQGYMDIWENGEVQTDPPCCCVGICQDYQFREMHRVNGEMYISASQAPNSHCSGLPTYEFTGTTNGVITLPGTYEIQSGTSGCISVNQTDNSELYVVAVSDAVGKHSGLLYSPDYGATWSVVAQLEDLFGGGCTLCNAAVACAPWVWEPDPNVLCMAGRLMLGTWTSEFLYYSETGGSVWLNKRGNWITEFGNWTGDNGSSTSSRTQLIPLPRVGANE